MNSRNTPGFEKNAFACPYCDAYAAMKWVRLYYTGSVKTETYHCICQSCGRISIWIKQGYVGNMVHPKLTTTPMAHLKTPENILRDYNEARYIAADSPRAAAALLRLAIQKLCKHLGESGESLNSDIGSLVKKGLPPEIQKALDIVRVTGNNAVHPGEINPDDIAEVSNSLFMLFNEIVEVMIARPSVIQELFDNLPEAAKEQIDRRDGKKQENE